MSDYSFRDSPEYWHDKYVKEHARIKELEAAYDTMHAQAFRAESVVEAMRANLKRVLDNDAATLGTGRIIQELRDVEALADYDKGE